MSSSTEKNRRILIVDDEADVLEFLRIFLESLNWEVTTVSTTKQAFEELDGKQYFLVITDIAMPDMDGYEFINKVKEKNYGCQIALMTGFGYNPKHTLVKIYKTIRYPCLFKPFNRAKLTEAVKNAFNAYHNGDEAAQDDLNEEKQD